LGSQHLERQLTAIFAADVAGYGRLTDADEEGTHAQLKGHIRAVVDPNIIRYRGRTVKNTGDGMLAEFGSVVDAVRCAVQIQRCMAKRNTDVPCERRIEFRIGINVADIIIDDGDIFGDGVNVAVRLESLAEAGGICVSDQVREYTQGQLDAVFEDAGEQQLKNIARPVRVYRVRLDGTPKTAPPLVLPATPSIAVLPFQNLSNDPEQEYFADGMVEDITMALSRIRWLFVVARNSSFTYKGRVVDVKRVGRELGVRYVLEGSVRKAANRVRITGQLIDAATGGHLWADRFDGPLDDIFDLQDQVTAGVVGAIAPKLQEAEIARARHKPTESLDAYDYFLRGTASLYRWTREGNDEALMLFYKAIELDPDFTTAHGMAAGCYFLRQLNGWTTDRLHELAEIMRLAERVTESGKDDAVALSFGGLALGRVVGDLEGGAALIDRALVLNPNLATAWHASGCVRAHLHDPDVALVHLARAMRLSPLDPLMFAMQMVTAFAHHIAGRYAEAATWAEKAFREQPNFLPTIRLLAAINALSGRLEEAHKWVARGHALDPDMRISNLKDRVGPWHPEDFARYVQALRLAGLPE
jgi:adenylate cyclase